MSEMGGETVGGTDRQFRSGFVSLMGRPNAGKSTLLNQICGEKIAITSNKAQTTRHCVRGVLNREDLQIVFVDTPGIHKPVSALGTKLNEAAQSTIGDVDISVLVIDALAPIGRGDLYVAEKLLKNKTDISPIMVLNKIDRAKPEQVLEQLSTASELGFAQYFPLSARTGRGVDVFIDYLCQHLEPGPRYYPVDMVTDQRDAIWIAELVREQLFRMMRQELPYSIATRVTELDWPYIECEIIVERESQKGMVIGKGGDQLKKVGIAVREQLRDGAFLKLKVVVDKGWQDRPERLEYFGY